MNRRTSKCPGCVHSPDLSWIGPCPHYVPKDRKKRNVEPGIGDTSFWHDALICKGECDHPDRVYGIGYGSHIQCSDIRIRGERGGCPINQGTRPSRKKE